MSRIPDFDPLVSDVATRDFVNQKRNKLEVSPIQVEGYLVDCKPIDLERMNHALLIMIIDNQNLIPWTMADNTVRSMTRDQLATLCTQVHEACARRSLLLHNFANELKARLPDLTARQVLDATWPT